MPEALSDAASAKASTIVVLLLAEVVLDDGPFIAMVAVAVAAELLAATAIVVPAVSAALVALKLDVLVV